MPRRPPRRPRRPRPGRERESGDDAEQPLVEARAAPGETGGSGADSRAGRDAGRGSVHGAGHARRSGRRRGDGRRGSGRRGGAAELRYAAHRQGRPRRDCRSRRARRPCDGAQRAERDRLGNRRPARRMGVAAGSAPYPPAITCSRRSRPLPDGRQVESEQVVVLSVPDPASGEGADRALAVLMPRDGAGKSTVLQQPPPATEEAVDVTRLDEDDTRPDDQAGAADAPTGRPSRRRRRDRPRCRCCSGRRCRGDRARRDLRRALGRRGRRHARGRHGGL